jgi:hypothetical protein
MSQRVKIYISPLILKKFGPEVCWTWRLLLTSLGYCWEEVNDNSSDCDIAYVLDIEKNAKHKLCIKADPNLWSERANLTVKKIGSFNELLCPVFQNKSSEKLDFVDHNNRIVCHRDIIFDVFWLVTGQEEKRWVKNAHGHHTLTDDAFFQKEVFRKSLASRIGCLLEEKFLELKFPPYIHRWPLNKKAAACLSHDVDYPEVKRFLEPLRIILRRGLSGVPAAIDVIRGKRKHWHFDSWVKMEKRLGVRSAFYFVCSQGSLVKYLMGIPDPFYDIYSGRFKRIFQYLVNEGFEIGLHASYLAYSDQKLIESEIQALQQISGQEILGNRHHYWHLDPDDIESTLKLHETVGLKYDSSLTHEKYIGWRRGLTWPFFPFHQKERRELRTLQIQSTWMDDQLFGYKMYNQGDIFDSLRMLANTAAQQGGCLSVNVHDYVYDEKLYPGWSKTYLWLIDYIMDRSDFWIATPAEISKHWKNRYHKILQDSLGLEKGVLEMME